MNKHQAINTLRNAGLTNPMRLAGLLQEAIDIHQLDLSGLTVLTECASGAYVVTPVIATLAGADRVIGITGASRFASAEETILQTRALEILCSPPIEVEMHSGRSLDLFAQADVVTNLGFVRPIDAEMVAVMKPTAVLPLMCEAWEVRPGDVDLDACINKGILAMGTDEEHSDLGIFAYVGWLVLKLLFDAQIEVHKCRIAVVSSDKFGRTISDLLTSLSIAHRLVPGAHGIADLQGYDALVVADYSRSDWIIGPESELTTQQLADIAPQITVIHLAGRLDVAGLIDQGIPVHPGNDVDAHRMTISLAGLGPKPVVELHAAGLAVGKAMAEARLLRKLDIRDAIKYALANSPADPHPGYGDE